MIPGLLDALEDVNACLDRIRIDELPSVPIDGDDWNRDLEPVAAIYFVRSRSKGILYVGKAGNLRRRWHKQWWIHPDGSGDWTTRHHREEQSVRFGDCDLFWMETPTQYLDVLEALLIFRHDPPWNGRRSAAHDRRHANPAEPDR
jgi:hypothetical protein